MITEADGPVARSPELHRADAGHAGPRATGWWAVDLRSEAWRLPLPRSEALPIYQRNGEPSIRLPKKKCETASG